MMSQFPINANPLTAQVDFLNSNGTNIGQSNALKKHAVFQQQLTLAKFTGVNRGPFWANTLSPSEQF